MDPGLYLRAHEHQVGAGVDGVGYQVLVLLLHLLGVLEDGLGVLLRHLVVRGVVVAGVLDLPDLLDVLELDEEDDGVDLVGVQPLDGVGVHVDDAVLVLELKQRN